MPASVEIDRGTRKLNDYKRKYEVVHDPYLQTMVDGIMKKMVPHTGRPEFPWEITIVEDADDLRGLAAESLGGGKIIIKRSALQRLMGMSGGNDKWRYERGVVNTLGELYPGHRAVANSLSTDLSSYVTEKDLVASIVGHEMAHAAALHSQKVHEFGTTMATLVVILSIGAPYFAVFCGLWYPFVFATPFWLGKIVEKYISRVHEYEADRFGMMLAAKAGFNPEAMLVQRRWGSRDTATGWFNTHPGGKDWYAANKIHLAEIKNGQFLGATNV